MNAKVKTTLKAWPLIAAATIGISMATTLVAEAFGMKLTVQASLGVIRRMAGLNWPFVKMLLYVLVRAPVLEELVFRGLLWRLPAGVLGWIFGKARLPRALAAGLSAVLAVVASILFSAAHYVNMPWPDNAFAALFFFGLAQCWLYRRVGKWHAIWCPVLNHFLFNLTNLVLLFTLPESWLQ